MSLGRVLYLDDEEPLVFLVTRMLTRLGYEGVGFTEATRALAVFESDPTQFVLVLSDLSMPGITGLDFARQVLERSPQTRMAILTGHVEPSDAAQAIALGVRAVE